LATIRKRGDRYHVQIRKQGHLPLTRSFGRRADADAWARKIESEIERGIYLDTSEAQRTTLSQALERYTNEVLSGLRSSNRWLSKKKIVDERLGKRSLASLTTAVLAEYRDQRLMSVGPQTVKHEIGLI
jgi:Arc/MetJ-type ribon-helix-helix transcriptional regulator